jgi:hypothetical protein
VNSSVIGHFSMLIAIVLFMLVISFVLI